MKCPFCNFADTKVIDSRAQDDNSVIRRRRVCEQCGKRFTTYERVDMIPITVIKRDGTREIFDKAKLQNGCPSGAAALRSLIGRQRRISIQSGGKDRSPAGSRGLPTAGAG